MVRKLKIAALALLAAVVLAVPFWAPPQLRKVEWFDVRRVEVIGARLLAPHQVLAASGLRGGQNVWDDLDALERALNSHPTVARAEVSRRLPGGLRFRIEEKRPIAYVEMEALAPITALGEILPVDPAQARMDLPVIRADWAKASEGARRGLLLETDRLRRLDPELLSRISEIRGEKGKVDVLMLSHPQADIVMPAGVDMDRLARLRAVLSDLERRLPATDSLGRPAPPARVDLRFDEQVVVRIPSSV